MLAELEVRVVKTPNQSKPQNEKATRQQGDLFFSRENSSNGGLDSVKTFCTKSYEPKKGGVKQFLGNKCLSFQ